jgi:hypothetical protein
MGMEAHWSAVELGTCIWDIKSGYVLCSDYFMFAPEDLKFIKDFCLAYSKRIRQSHAEVTMFINVLQPLKLAKKLSAIYLGAAEDVQGRRTYQHG